MNLDSKVSILLNKIISESRSISYFVQGASRVLITQIYIDMRKQQKERINKDFFKTDGEFNTILLGEPYNVQYTCYEVFHDVDVDVNFGAAIDLENKTLTVEFVKIDNKVDEANLLDSITHELEHLYQFQEKGKSLINFHTSGNMYEKAVQFFKDKRNNGRVAMLAKIIYISYWCEQDAFVNGLYAYLDQCDIEQVPQIKIFAEKTEAYKRLKFLMKCQGIFEREDMNSEIWLSSMGPFGKTPKWFKTLLGKTIRRLSRKIGHVLYQFRKDKFGDNLI